MAGKRVSSSPSGTTATVPEAARRGGILVAQSRVVPEETPVAFTYGGSTHAVMMATPPISRISPSASA